MTFHNPTPPKPAAIFWLGDVLAWAEANNESYDAIRELYKIPARMQMNDNDIGLIPASVEHFDKLVAPTAYGVVSNADDLEKARRRGNSRARTLLVRFHTAMGIGAPRTGTEEWDQLIETVKEHEGFTDKGALFSTSTHKSLYTLRARCRSGPAELVQSEVDRVANEASAETRKSIRKSVHLINRLISLQNVIPELAGLLPATVLVSPSGSDRARRILWSTLPETLRQDVESTWQRALDKPEDKAATVAARLDAGEDYEAVLAEVNAFATTHARRLRRPIKNSAASLEGYRNAVTWVWRAVDDLGGSGEAATLAALMSRENLEAACEDQVHRSQNALTLKDPRMSQTLNSRLTNLRTLAGHGLRQRNLVALVDLMKVSYWEYIVTPKQMTDEAEHTCKMLRDNPLLAARFVRAPYTLAEQAMKDLAKARAAQDENAEDRALRLYASAVLHAIQLSRPMRTSNLIRIRHCGSPGCAGNITWIKPRKHAEITFESGEIKNDIKVLVTVLDDDAEILWKWQNELRARFVELRKIPDSPYLFPGSASPRLVKNKVVLPDGCLSPSTMAELWALGGSKLGLGLTPHECRHAVATLTLALHPGNFAKAASILGDTEETVRKHYGCDSGQAAAVEMRKALLATNPELFTKLKRKLG